MTPPVTPPDFGPISPVKNREIDLAIEFIKSRNPPGYVVTAYDLTWRLGRGMTSAEESYARKVGVFFAKDAEPTAPVDRSGLDLGDGTKGPRVNGVIGEEWYSFTFDVDSAHTAAEFRVMGSPGRFFDKLTSFVTGPNDGLLAATREFPITGVNHYELVSIPAAGKYTYHVKVNKPGILAVEYRQV